MTPVKAVKNFFRRLSVRRRCNRCGLEFPIFCKIRGVSSSDRQGALAQSRPKDRLQLVHVPLEAFPFNVYVYSIELNRILGYIEKSLSQKLVFVFGKGFCLDGEIAKMTGGPPLYSFFGCNIQIFSTTSFMIPYLI